MKTLRQTQFLIVLLLAALTLGACSSATSLPENDEIATRVAQTLATAELALDYSEIVEQTATDNPIAPVPGDLQPLSPEECEQLAGFMINRMFTPPLEQQDVDVAHQGETGSGCQAIGAGDGQMFPDIVVLEDAMRGILGELGWTEDMAAPTCLGTGGSGPGANNYCFTQADALCELFIHMDPIDETLCPDDEPIGDCFERLTPEQILYTAELTCARDISPSLKALDSDLMRIEFDPGAIQARAQGEVAAGGSDHYVLYVMAGQEMTVNLLDRTDALMGYDTAILVIWGDEGTVLISSHADALFWSGELPLTQDYFINVKSVSDRPVPYTLEVIIPPKRGTSQVEYNNTDLGFRISLPASWEGYSILTSNWEGYRSGESGDEVVEQGPMISIVHPKSTVQQPRQNIPIMVFSIEKWKRLLGREYHLGPPIGPAELGRNSYYVFAIPARYNYAFLEGWEEIEEILRGDPLTTFEPDAVP